MRRGLLLVVVRGNLLIGAVVCAGLTTQAVAQSAAPNPAANPPAETTPQSPPPPTGQVIIQSHGEPPPGPGEPGYPASASQAAPQQPVVHENAKADLTDADRSALLISAYDLDVRVSPARSGLSVRAQLTVRNQGATPLKQLALQISSTLHWDSATLIDGPARTHLPLAQHQLDTDADHTGAETEAILPLPKPLAPGASASLDLFYSGTVAQSAGRLERLGANATQQQSTDWDAISPSWTGLRGFGDVLWYPTASPQLFLAEGNSLFEAVGRSRLREQRAEVHLRLSVEYTSGAPVAAYFCGRRQPLKAVADEANAAAATGSGLATADFPGEPLGFRTPSLFVLQSPETLPGGGSDAADTPGPGVSSSSSSAPDAAEPAAAKNTPYTAKGTSANAAPPQDQPSPAGESPFSSGPPFLAIETADTGSIAGFDAAADRVVPLLREWLGPRPLSALTVIDHNGQPFQDGPLLVAPIAILQASPESAALLQSLARAWVQTGQPWMDDGLGQFFALLWTEREQGRGAANAELDELMRPVALAEPEIVAGPDAAAGQPLVSAGDDVFYRRKAAAVWWMLRELVGDGNLHQALSAWRMQPVSQAPAAEQAVTFEHLLERLSGKNLGWFFADWVLRDRGLPDLTITDLAAEPETARSGHPSGWIVAVTVRNEGGAVADVPLIVRSGNAQIQQRIRVPGLASVTQRVLIETSPTAVQVNDGSTPELRTSTHTREITLESR